jgi:hypothetical protein
MLYEKEVCEILKRHINEIIINYGKLQQDWNDIRPNEGQMYDIYIRS